jgi:hypothetical protein
MSRLNLKLETSSYSDVNIKKQCNILVKNTELKPGTVVCTYNPSYSGVWDRKIIWALEFKASLGNIQESVSKNNKNQKTNLGYEDIKVPSSL